MSHELLFDFTVDKAANAIFIEKEFDAGQSLVWDAFTRAEILDQWWAPQPLTSRTKLMDFRVGGRRLYAMINEEGTENWGVQDYTSITPKSNFKFLAAFSDAEGNINPQFSGSEWDLDFTPAGDTTKVSITIKYKSAEILEKIIEMGFRAGMTVILKHLETVLAATANK